MSRFFDETRKAQQGRLRAPSPGAFDLQQVMETVKQADAVVGEVADSRLGQCGKIHLPSTSGVILDSNGDAGAQSAAESYRALRTRLMRLQAVNGLRSLVISSALPREGKTLTAMNLALSYAQLRNGRVLLVDADLRTRGLTHLLGAPPGPGLAEVLSGQTEYDRAILATDIPNFYVMGAGSSSASPAELFSNDRWKEFTGWSSEAFKIILVDAPPILPLADFELITAGCDGVLVVVRALSTQRELLQKAAGHVDSKKLLGLVFNAIEGGPSGNYYHLAYTGTTRRKGDN